MITFKIWGKSMGQLLRYGYIFVKFLLSSHITQKQKRSHYPQPQFLIPYF